MERSSFVLAGGIETRLLKFLVLWMVAVAWSSEWIM